MKIRPLLLALMFVLVSGVSALAKPDPVELYVEAYLTEDAAGLEKLLAPNYLHINGNGYLQDKEHFLENLRNGKMVVERLTITDVKESRYGDASMLTGTVVFKGKFEPKLPQGLHRVTMVLEKQGGENKILLFQATPVRKGSTNPTDLVPARERKAKTSPAPTPAQ